MSHFTNCTTKEEAAKEYRRLAMLHHPDHGGDTRTMQDINTEYAAFLSHCAYKEAWTRADEAHDAGRKSAVDFHDMDQVEAVLKEKLEALLNLGLDINIEVIGLWLWVTGNTRKYKDQLGRNGIGLKWHKVKTAWYYPGVPSWGKKNSTLDEIRSKYGSHVYQTATEEN